MLSDSVVRQRAEVLGLLACIVLVARDLYLGAITCQDARRFILAAVRRLTSVVVIYIA